MAAAVIGLGALAPPPGLVGQAVPAADSTSQVRAWLPVAGAALAVAATVPFDGRIRTWIQAPPRQESSVLGRAADGFTLLGAELPWVAGAALWGYARAFDHPALADAVWHVGEGTVAASALALAIKVAVHRTRPYVVPHDPDTFFHGGVTFSDSRRFSFPSGHSTVAFAVAAAGSQEVAVHWPRHARLAAWGFYGVASGVAFARVYDDKHWASDVVAGAALGTLVSRAVVRRAHRAGRVGSRGAEPTVVTLPDGSVAVGFRILLP